MKDSEHACRIRGGHRPARDGRAAGRDRTGTGAGPPRPRRRRVRRAAEGVVRPVPAAPPGTARPAAHRLHAGGNAHLARGQPEARRTAPQARLRDLPEGEARPGDHARRDPATAARSASGCERETNMHLVPAEGALPYRTFYEYIAERGFPVTQFIRHGSHPEFTPEPDMIHDCLGHVPPLMNRTTPSCSRSSARPRRRRRTATRCWR